jgi:hypothetical protein
VGDSFATATRYVQVPLQTVVVLSCLAIAGAAEASEVRCAWAGQRLFVWDGGGQFHVFDPATERWQSSKPSPWDGEIRDHQLVPCGEHAVAVYWRVAEQTHLYFERCFASGDWRPGATLAREDIRDANGTAYSDGASLEWSSSDRKATSLPVFAFRFAGATAMGNSVLAFFNVYRPQEPVLGIRLTEGNVLSLLPRKGAPRGAVANPAVYCFGNRLLYYGFVDVDGNDSTVWDQSVGSWSVCKERTRRVDFGHCKMGDAVFVFGGGSAGSSGADLASPETYVFRADRWEELSALHGPCARTQPNTCWTGKEVLVWGGRRFVRPGRESPSGEPLDSVMSYSVKDNTWKRLPSEDAPAPRYACYTVWTGKEMHVWGGHRSLEGSIEDDSPFSGYAYCLATGRWRTLPVPLLTRKIDKVD